MANLLFIGGGRETLPALHRAKSLGYCCVIVDGSPDAPGMVWARRRGQKWLLASTYDFAGVLDAVGYSGGQIDGVAAIACDVGPTVSFVAQELGLPHISLDTAMLSWDKYQLKKRLSAAGIPTPRPVDYVTKPAIQGRGGRGVQLVSGSLFERDGVLLLSEEYIPGPQISAECIVWDGEVVHCATSDRNYAEHLLPLFIEDGGSAPSQEGWLCRPLMQECVEALGIKAGTIKADIVLDERTMGDATIIELAIGRMGPSVNNFWPVSTGIDFLAAAFAVACGDDPRPYLEPKWTPRCIAARCELPGRPTYSGERGRFFWGLGESKEEAIKKAEDKRRVYCENQSQSRS